MNLKSKTTFRSLVCLLLTAMLCMSAVPTAFAAQENGYHDPAEHWLTANNRTNELDANAVVTRETFTCYECGRATSFEVFRTPEYTRDGQTAMSRNVKYSDGTMAGGEGTGSVLDGTPGKDAYYTGYHWTKSVCETCGGLNTNMAKGDYGYLKNVYWLYDCAAEFMEELDETVAYEYADSTYHTKTTTGGEYCCFCYGTNHTEKSVLEKHDMQTEVLPQPANGRFAVVEKCSLCDYSKYKYVAAKSVIADYYGVADGKPHTISVTDLSESGVRTSIRYGNSADNCTLTSAPNYTEEGQYTVYYEITYTYKGTEMTENGVAYVWLRDETTAEDGSCACGCGDPDCGCQDKNCGGSCCDQSCGGHNFVLLDSTKASCLTLGYDRYLCTECGKIEKRDYTAALGHSWQSVVIREATCETDGKLLNLCSRCGQMEVTATAKGEHEYETYTVKATCTNPGYTVKECSVCGDRHITNITSALAHEYETITVPASCETGGKTIHRCEGCGSSFITDYTDPLGHSWDNGTEVTGATCTGEGVTEYRCTRCGYHKLDGLDANGHTPDHAATCTEPSICTRCGAVLATATGHKAGDWIIDKEATTSSEGSKHTECVNCGEKLETQTIEKIYNQAATDSKGEAVVGGYLVTVTDTDTTNPVAGATVTLNKDNTLSILLPAGRLLDYADQTTVTVQHVGGSSLHSVSADGENFISVPSLLLSPQSHLDFVGAPINKSPVEGLPVFVVDQNDNYAAAVTDKAGQITVPENTGKTNANGKATVGYEDADGSRFTLTVKVEDYETGRPIEGADVSIGKTGNITVTLPDGVDMDEDNRITITVTDNKKNPHEGLNVTVKGDLGQSIGGKTDENGKLTVPEAAAETERHSAYIVGYPDGTFGPSRSLTRSEAAAIFARLLADKNGDVIYNNVHCSYSDVSGKAWYAGYVKYLETFGVVKGYEDGTYRPNAAITRAEFVTMAVRFYAAYGVDEDIPSSGNTVSFSDVNSAYWAADYIRQAAASGWVIGYTDGTFGGESEITRAEVVTIVNRVLDREADTAYLSQNIKKLNTFSDMTEKHWAYEAVMEAANAHTASTEGTERWLNG